MSMLDSKFVRDLSTTFSVLIFTLCNLQISGAVETNSTTSTNTSTCTPLNCVAVCTPACGDLDTCVLRTMTNCAVCPSSQCINRITHGLPPSATGSTNSQSSPSSDSDNTGLIGGIVGGLAAVGILVGIGVFCYIKKAKKKRKLPFAFTDGGMGILSQEKFQPQPSVATTLAQQQNRSTVPISPREPNRYIGLSELSYDSLPSSPAPPTPQHTINRSIINPIVSPISNNNNNYINNQSPSAHDVPVNNHHDPNSNQATVVSDANTSHNSSHFFTTPVIGNGSVPVVPEEFEEKIALQNKRISQILNSNPRLSRGSAFTQPPLPIIENRTSGISFTTDDDSEYDDDDKSTSSYNPQQAVVQSRSPYQGSQAVQVTRAKAQIMRVNSVRSNSGGLGRSESVRTILTSVATPPTLPQLDLAGDSLLTDSFPATPNNRSFATIEDPFLDTVNDAKK